MRVATEIGEKRVASSQAKGEGPVPLKVGKRFLFYPRFFFLNLFFLCFFNVFCLLSFCSSISFSFF